MNQFVEPAINWAGLTPVLIIFGAAVLGVLVEAFVPRTRRRPVQVVLATLAIAAALVAVVWRWTIVAAEGPSHLVFLEGSAPAISSVNEDGPALAAQAILLVIALVAMLVIADRLETGEGSFTPSGATAPGSEQEDRALKVGLEQTEVYPLVMFSVLGMMVFASATDFLTLFVALEVLSLPLYVLSGLARRRRLLSQEASLKYFVLGALSSGILLFGIVMLYGFAGSFHFAAIAAAVPAATGMDILLLVGAVLVLIGLLFKVGAVPFHAWTPDVYQGAPTPVTGFMAAATKLAAFAAMLRFIYVVVPGLEWDLAPIAWTVIILTMLVGTVMGLVQSNVKRLLAYSSIAHAGFVLLGVFALQPEGPSAVLFYLLAYGVATVGAFAVVTAVREKDAAGNVTAEANDLSAFKGLGRKNPWLAGAMTLFLLSFAGIPLTAGFIGKFVVFSAAVKGGLGPLVVLAVLASAATAYFYFRILVLMFFHEPEGETSVVVDSEGLAAVAVGVCALVTIGLGIYPGPVLELVADAAVYLP